jgi:hypothetical protein
MPSESAEKQEIQITRRMLDAGLGAYYLFDTEYDLDDEIVKTIYRAMAEAARRQPQETG